MAATKNVEDRKQKFLVVGLLDAPQCNGCEREAIPVTTWENSWRHSTLKKKKV